MMKHIVFSFNDIRGYSAVYRQRFVLLIAKPFAHVTLPKLWSTHDSPASTLKTASTMKESINLEFRH